MGVRTRTFEESNQLRDWFNLVIGEVLLGSPWILRYTSEATPTWSARVAGAAISVLAIAALLKYAEWEEWLMLFAGLWLIVSPWALGFAGSSMPTMAHLGVGFLVAIVAAWELWDFRRLMSARARSAAMRR